MGDMADYYLDQAFNSEYPFVDWAEPPDDDDQLVFPHNPYKTCRCCGAKGLTWKTYKKKWRLFKGRKLHKCPIHPLPQHKPKKKNNKISP